jgi:hypothetical protein
MDKPSTDPSDSFLGVRIPTAIHDRYRELAKYHGRSVSEETKWAMIVFDQQVVLNELMTAEAKAELGDRHAAAVAEVKRDMQECMSAALRGRLAVPPESREPVLL